MQLPAVKSAHTCFSATNFNFCSSSLFCFGSTELAELALGGKSFRLDLKFSRWSVKVGSCTLDQVRRPASIWTRMEEWKSRIA